MKLASLERWSRTRWLFVATLLASCAMLAFASASGCVGDDAASSGNGAGDSSVDGNPSTGDGGGGGDDAMLSDSQAADAACKMCNGQCVSLTDPAYGCSPTSCTPCAPSAHTQTQTCNGESCGIGACAVGFDDLDTDSGDGCEAQNPRSFQPAKLALWLTAGAGVTLSGDGGVTAWANQSGNDGGTGAVAVDGHATLDKTLWPTLTGAPSIVFDGSERFGVDLKAIENTPYTLFMVTARYGDNGYSCLLGSPTYPVGSPGCPAQSGIAFNICYGPANTTFFNEIYCNSLPFTVPANTSSGYQEALLSNWWDGSLNHVFLNGATIDDTGQYPGPLKNLSAAPSWLGCGAGGGLGFKGLMAEVIVYSALLSGPDQAAVRAYLKTKWKLP